MKKAVRGNQRRRRDGPTSDQIDEVTAMFGEDYGDFDDDEEEEDEEGDGTITLLRHFQNSFCLHSSFSFVLLLNLSVPLFKYC